jgi:hypothetical protein
MGPALTAPAPMAPAPTYLIYCIRKYFEKFCFVELFQFTFATLLVVQLVKVVAESTRAQSHQSPEPGAKKAGAIRTDC